MTDTQERDDRLRDASLELLAALETLYGFLDLGAEAVYVRANLDRAAELLGQPGAGSG